MDNFHNILFSKEMVFIYFSIATIITIFIMLYILEYNNFLKLKLQISEENKKKLEKEKMEKEKLDRLNKLSSSTKNEENKKYSLDTDSTHTLRRRYYSKYNREITKKDLDFARNNNSKNSLEFDLINWLLINDIIVNDFHKQYDRYSNDNKLDKSDDLNRENNYETKEHSYKHDNHYNEEKHTNTHSNDSHYSHSSHSDSWGGSSSGSYGGGGGGSSGGD